MSDPEENKYHPEAMSQGRMARLYGDPLSESKRWYPPGSWLHESFEAGWREVDEDPGAPKEELR